MNTQEDWFFLAAEDLAGAEHLAKTMHPVPASMVCFHCQQSAEKYLKGYLAPRLTDEPPYTHDKETDRGSGCKKHRIIFRVM